MQRECACESGVRDSVFSWSMGRCCPFLASARRSRTMFLDLENGGG